MTPLLYLALVIAVLDGDSLRVRVEIWPQLFVEPIIRIHGIDTPEIRGAQCPEEKTLGLKARAALQELVPIGYAVSLMNVRPDKFGGRFLATVRSAAGNVGEILIKKGLAHRYDGSGPRSGWCSMKEKPS